MRGEPPGPEIEARLKETLVTLSPFKGLNFFREEDAPFFFGREAAIEALASALARKNFLALVGASGSGKSSVVRAGLVPRLRRDLAEPWEIATVVPNDRPLYNLAAALLPLLEPDIAATDRLIQTNKQAAALADGSLHVRDVIEEIIKKHPTRSGGASSTICWLQPRRIPCRSSPPCAATSWVMRSAIVRFPTGCKTPKSTWVPCGAKNCSSPSRNPRGKARFQLASICLLESTSLWHTLTALAVRRARRTNEMLPAGPTQRRVSHDCRPATAWH